MKFAFKAAASEMATALQLNEEAAHWKEEEQLPAFDGRRRFVDFRQRFPRTKIHIVTSHAMSIHPLGLLDYSQGEESQRIINATIKRLQDVGPDYWCGYSYSWFET